MTYVLDEIINGKLQSAFAALGLDEKYAAARPSDRPDLSDFQCNGALALAKIEKKNPRAIGEEIAARLREDKDFAKVSVDGPGFLNLTLTDSFLADVADRMAGDERFGCAVVATPKTVVMDYGGPNVAKEMHVGHLRSGVIGESMRRIEKFIGNRPIADVHFGDWGTPIGMILAEVIAADGSLDKMETYDIAEITRFYKQANSRCKEDPAAKETARQITARFQDGDPVYRKAWQHIRRVSVEAVKENYRELGVHFDLWLGESDAHETCFEIKRIAEEKGLLEYSDGAWIIRLDESNKPKPPVILEKSDGGFTYQATDLATIKMRVDDLHADEIIYFVDKRQSLHFEQVFEAAEKLGIAPNVKLLHIGFGTVNGTDGKPFKTRDGGVMNLADLIKMSKDKVSESMPAADPANGLTQEYIDHLVEQVAVGAIKFQDLKNNIASGYNRAIYPICGCSHQFHYAQKQKHNPRQSYHYQRGRARARAQAFAAEQRRFSRRGRTRTEHHLRLHLHSGAALQQFLQRFADNGRRRCGDCRLPSHACQTHPRCPCQAAGVVGG